MSLYCAQHGLTLKHIAPSADKNYAMAYKLRVFVERLSSVSNLCNIVISGSEQRQIRANRLKNGDIVELFDRTGSSVFGRFLRVKKVYRLFFWHQCSGSRSWVDFVAPQISKKVIFFPAFLALYSHYLSGTFLAGKIDKVTPFTTHVTIQHRTQATTSAVTHQPYTLDISLAVGFPKVIISLLHRSHACMLSASQGDRSDILIEKVTEIGVTHILPLITKRTIGNINTDSK